MPVGRSGPGREGGGKGGNVGVCECRHGGPSLGSSNRREILPCLYRQLHPLVNFIDHKSLSLRDPHARCEPRVTC